MIDPVMRDTVLRTCCLHDTVMLAATVSEIQGTSPQKCATEGWFGRLDGKEDGSLCFGSHCLPCN